MTEPAEFAATVRGGENQINLAAAALALARIHAPVDRPERYQALLDDWAARLAGRVGPGIEPMVAMDRLSQALANKQGLRGNRRHYYDPLNSCLNAVLDRRLGIPITLSVIYLEVGWRLGLPLAGVGLPGHFLVKYGDERAELIVDPFNGGAVLTRADCAERLRQVYGRPVALEEHHLAAVTRKQILARMLNNLKALYLGPAALDYRRALATIEHLLVLSPWALDQIRDRGLIRQQLGDLDGAAGDLQTYLEYAGDADDAQAVQRRLASLRRQPPGEA